MFTDPVINNKSNWNLFVLLDFFKFRRGKAFERIRRAYSVPDTGGR